MKTDNKIQFSGSHKEIGIQIGQLYNLWGKKEVFIPPFANEYYISQLKTYQKFFPAYMDYLEGIAEGMGLPKDKIFLSYLTGYLHVARVAPNNRCSTFAVKNDNGVFIGRNYDWRQSSEANSKIATFDFSDKSANSFTGISDMATWRLDEKADPKEFLVMVDDAWNNKGLYICLNGAPGKRTVTGMCTPHVVQLIAERCGSTKEAVDLIIQIPITEPKIFTIADKSGCLAVVEKPVDKETKVRISDSQIIATNHFNHKDLLLDNKEIFVNVPFHSTFARYRYIETMFLEYPNLNFKDIFPIMDRPPVIQNWRDEDVVTCWICALNVKTRQYEVHLSPLGDRQIIKSNV